MSRFVWLLSWVLLGCGAPSQTEVNADDRNDADRGDYRPVAIPDLRTKKTGIDWPSFLGPNRDNKSPEKGILTKWPTGGPRIVWHRELPGDDINHTYGYGGPTISKGRLFQFDRVDDKLRLTALESETGKELWKFEYVSKHEEILGYETGPRCCPVVDDDRVYLFGIEGMLHCVSAVDGKPIWKVDTKAEFGVVQNFFGVGSTPLVEGDLLIVQVGGSPPGSPETYSGRVKGNGSGIVAFNKYTGKLQYKITDELASYASPVAATIGERRWCFVFARGGLVGFEPKSGKVDFHYPWRSRLLESVNASNPVVVKDQVLVSECYSIGSSLLAVKPGGYDVVWKDGDLPHRRQSLATHWNTPIHHEGYVYGCSGRNPPDAELRCIEWKTGKTKWREPTRSRSSLLYVDGHFVCLTEDGTLQLLKASPEKFDLVAEAQVMENDKFLLRSPAWAAPVLSHDLLYVRGKDRLVCLELIPRK